MKFNWLSKLIPLAVLTVGLVTLSLAQAAGPSGGQVTAAPAAHHGKHPLVAALEQLNLSPQQKSQILGMLKQRKADNKAFRKANKGNPAALKAHSKQENQAFMTSLKGVLTQPQWQQFEANLKALKGKGRQNTASIGSGTNSPVKP